MNLYRATVTGRNERGQHEFDYLIRARDIEDARGAFGHDPWTHGLGDFGCSGTDAPQVKLSRRTDAEFPANHDIVCLSHPTLHVGWSGYVVIPSRFPGCAPRTPDGRPRIQHSFGRHWAVSCWWPTDEQAQFIHDELDPGLLAVWAGARIWHPTGADLARWGVPVAGEVE